MSDKPQQIVSDIIDKLSQMAGRNLQGLQIEITDLDQCIVVYTVPPARVIGRGPTARIAREQAFQTILAEGLRIDKETTKLISFAPGDPDPNAGYSAEESDAIMRSLTPVQAAYFEASAQRGVQVHRRRAADLKDALRRMGNIPMMALPKLIAVRMDVAPEGHVHFVEMADTRDELTSRLVARAQSMDGVLIHCDEDMTISDAISCVTANCDQCSYDAELSERLSLIRSKYLKELLDEEKGNDDGDHTA